MAYLHEKILRPDYPVYITYYYVAVLKDGSEQVVRSDIEGKVSDLIDDLNAHYKLDVVQIKSCDIFSRKKGSV